MSETPERPPRANLALYRKYRSATFADVIGQEHVTEPLSTALTAGRINHAYLFSGPRGCGKTSSARILARSLNCAQGPTPTPCGVCDSCIELAPNGSGSIDVIEIDAASHGGIDDARDLRERAFYAPARDRYKVYIIDEAHMVTTGGFNALLKLIEEPPEFLVFVFATTEPEKVLQTIRSRTHHYPFRLVPPGILRAHLERICAAEGATVEQAVFPLVVRAGGGSVRDSLSLLDQLLAGAGPEGVTYARAVSLLGVTDAALIDDMVDALAVGDAASVYGTVDRVVEAGHEPRRFAADLLDRLRDLLIIDAVPEAAEKGLLDAPEDTVARMVDQAARIGGASAARYAEIVHTALIDMRGTTAPRLVLELVCARMLLPDASADSAALVQRLERLERRQGMAPASPVPTAAAAPAPAPASNAAAAPAPVPAPAPAKAAPAKAAPAKAARPRGGARERRRLRRLPLLPCPTARCARRRRARCCRARGCRTRGSRAGATHSRRRAGRGGCARDLAGDPGRGQERQPPDPGTAGQRPGRRRRRVHAEAGAHRRSAGADAGRGEQHECRHRRARPGPRRALDARRRHGFRTGERRCPARCSRAAALRAARHSHACRLRHRLGPRGVGSSHPAGGGVAGDPRPGSGAGAGRGGTSRSVRGAGCRHGRLRLPRRSR